MKPAVMMGEPTYFRIVGGSNPFTRNRFGMRKKVSREKAIEQWHGLARTLRELGVDVYVIPPAAEAPGLVYPANAGVRAPDGTFILSTLIPARAAETPHYREFLTLLGLRTTKVSKRFEGEADLFPVADKMVFTHGKIEKQRFVLRRGMPPWKRVYGFRSDLAAEEELQKWFPGKEFVAAQLIKESFYHGDTAFCSFGAGRGYLLAYLPAVAESSRASLLRFFKERLIEISEQDAALYAANSFYVEVGGKKNLVMPQGVSEPLIRAVEKRGVEPVLVDVSEFLLKGGGSVKCMIGTLGFLPAPASETVREVRYRHLYLS